MYIIVKQHSYIVSSLYVLKYKYNKYNKYNKYKNINIFLQANVLFKLEHTLFTVTNFL